MAAVQVLPEYHRERLALLESLQLVLLKGEPARLHRHVMMDGWMDASTLLATAPLAWAQPP